MTDPRLDDVRFLSTPEGQAYLERLNRERDRKREPAKPKRPKEG